MGLFVAGGFSLFAALVASGFLFAKREERAKLFAIIKAINH